MIQKASQRQMKHLNARTVFRLIQSRAGASRAAIAKMTQLSPTSISTIVDELIRKGLVAEKAWVESSGAGRKAIKLEVNDTAKCLIGIEFGLESVSGTVFNLKHEPAATIREPFDPRQNMADQLPEVIGRVLRRLVGAAQERFPGLLGACVGVPAVLDADKKSIVFSSPLNVRNVDLVRLLKRQADCPVYIENETLLNAAVEQEAREKKASRFIYLSINDGLGVSVTIDGRQLQGAEGVFPEIGHMSIQMDGPPCVCGNRGCFERYVSIPAFVEDVRNALASDASSLVHGLCDGDVSRIGPELVAQAASQGDALAERAIRRTGELLGNGMINLIHLFQPDRIVIGGRLSALGPGLLDAVERRVRERAFAPFADRCTISLSLYQAGGISKGASMYALERALDDLL